MGIDSSTRTPREFGRRFSARSRLLERKTLDRQIRVSTRVLAFHVKHIKTVKMYYKTQ